MKILLLAAPLAILTVAPVSAQSTKTVTIDRPNYDGTRTITRDGQGDVTRDTDITRKSDGATATRDYDRTKTADGWTANGSRTGFNGKTSDFEASKVRNASGSVTTGTATGPNGRTLDYAGSRTRTGNGYTSAQSLTTGSGKTLWSRDKTVTRSNGMVDKSVNVTRAPGFNRGRAFGRGGFGFRRR